jgi:hypothetical protein
MEIGRIWECKYRGFLVKQSKMGGVIYLWMAERGAGNGGVGDGLGFRSSFNPMNYGSLETDSRIFLHQEAGSECAEYPVDAVYAWDQPDLHFYVYRGDHFFDSADLFFQETLGAGAGR